MEASELGKLKNKHEIAFSPFKNQTVNFYKALSCELWTSSGRQNLGRHISLLVHVYTKLCKSPIFLVPIFKNNNLVFVDKIKKAINFMSLFFMTQST